MTETNGDTSSVDCPKCGKAICDLWDYGNSLVDGIEIECPHCKQKVKVVRVETIYEVTLSDELCKHNWVSAVNEVVKSGEICTKCHAWRI